MGYLNHEPSMVEYFNDFSRLTWTFLLPFLAQDAAKEDSQVWTLEDEATWQGHEAIPFPRTATVHAMPRYDVPAGKLTAGCSRTEKWENLYVLQKG